jgi:hypothetical protein
MASLPERTRCRPGVLVAGAIFLSLAVASSPRSAGADEPVPHSRGLSHGTPQHQAPYKPGRTPYRTGLFGRPKYFVPPTNPRTPTWKMYGTPPGLVPGDWPSYAPFGFGGYRFPAVGPQAYR